MKRTPCTIFFYKNQIIFNEATCCYFLTVLDPNVFKIVFISSVTFLQIFEILYAEFVKFV